MLDARGVVKLVNRLNGPIAAGFRDKCADVFVRYLGGDDTLIAEIQGNRAEQERLAVEQPDHPARVFGEEVEAQQGLPEQASIEARRAELELRQIEQAIQCTEQAICREGIELAQLYVSALCSIKNSDMDGPDRVMARDLVTNAIAPRSTRMLTIPAGRAGEARDTVSNRHSVPVSDVVHHITGGSKRGIDNALLSRVGVAVAAEYRNRHIGDEPGLAERLVDGTTRMLKSYSTIEDPWVVDCVRRWMELNVPHLIPGATLQEMPSTSNAAARRNKRGRDGGQIGMERFVSSTPASVAAME